MGDSVLPLIMYHTSSSYLWVNKGCALVILFQAHSFNVPKIGRALLLGQIWESLVFRLHSKFGQIHLSIEASVTTTGTAHYEHHRLVLEPKKLNFREYPKGTK